MSRYLAMAFCLSTGKIYVFEKQTSYVIQPPKTRKELASWLEETKSIQIAKDVLVTILTRFFSKKKANAMAKIIIASKILTC
jgi:hypothetical protein